MAPLLATTTHYSILRGVHTPEALCVYAKKNGYSSIALTDRNNLYALPLFLDLCEKHGLKPIIGAELYHDGVSALVYAHGNRGYSNLCRIITHKHCSKSFDLAGELKAHFSGLTMATRDTSLLMELHRKLPVYYRITSLKRLPEAVRGCGIPALIVPWAAFITPEDYALHRLLRAIDNNTSLSRLPEEDCIPENAVIVPWEELRARFAVFEDAVAATEHFAGSLISKTDFGAPIMPEFNSDEPPPELLRRKAYEGAHYRYPELTRKITDRLEYELGVIEKKRYVSYFLVVDDIVKQSPRTCGRGSGAASLVAYCLGITNVDPIRYNLMFERFISPERKDPPDIDVDFAWDERDDVLDYVFEKYTGKHAAMVATHQTFGPRMALRETARVYGMTESEISTVTGKIPFLAMAAPMGYEIEEVFRLHPKLRDIPLDPPWPEIIRIAQRLLKMPRGIGTHCGGVIITPMEIASVAPVQISAKGYPIIQWEKDGAERMGLVKIDLLGNRSLAVIRDTLANLKQEKISINEQAWEPAHDPSTQRLLARGKSIGVFYVESPSMRLLQEKTGRGDFEHLVIHSSIIRPAANKWINEYIDRLKGKPWKQIIPPLSELLKDSYGILVYEEDVTRVAMAVAGFSYEHADKLRKLVTRQKSEEAVARYQRAFFEGVKQKRILLDHGKQIWEMILHFGGYSFCKPHSASYCRISYQSAWLKAHYPAPFMAAVMSNYGGFYTTQAYISESQRLGIHVYPPDVNASEDRFIARGNSISVGLCQIKGLSSTAKERILNRRHEGRLFRNVNDFLERCSIDESDAEHLVKAGALDSLSPKHNRPQIFWQMRCFYRSFNEEKSVPRFRSFSRLQLLRFEYGASGFLTACHPIQLVSHRRIPNTIKISMINKSKVNRFVVFSGWCVTSKTVATKSGESMQFVTFEDETGICETVLFPDAYTIFVRYLTWQEAFWVRGKVVDDHGAIIVEVRSIAPLKE
ncbi:MAG: DNA polymerase III subunit alpha [Chitinivibrionales bacterium]|nr:DNA polymerase III subunit alpha [Chitinivibrionales bacterium]